MVGAIVLAAWQLGGCSGVTNLLPTLPVEIDLSGGVGEFQVQANEAKTSSGTASFPPAGIQVGRGSIEFDPADITITPAGDAGGKGAVNLQSGGTLSITAWIAPVDELDTVCETGEQYGPFSVTLDENYLPTAISPEEFALSSTTIDLLNGGEFSLCIELISPIDASISVGTLTLNLGV